MLSLWAVGSSTLARGGATRDGGVLSGGTAKDDGRRALGGTTRGGGDRRSRGDDI
jgi:hypothetical protein